jgi:diguanylate cyclase (GGDEF)-like protein/PAS domain S-box-containing protein
MERDGRLGRSTSEGSTIDTTTACALAGAITLAAVTTAWTGVQRRSPDARRAWLLIVAGLAGAYGGAAGGTLSTALWLVGAVVTSVGLLDLARHVTRVWDRSRWIDSAVVALAAGTVAVAAAEPTSASAAVGAVRPAVSIFLLLLATRSLLAVRPRRASLRLLTLALLVRLAGDVVVWWVQAGERAGGTLELAATTAGAVLIAAAVNHPTVSAEPDQVLPWRRMGWVRFAVLASSLLLPLIALALLAASDGSSPITVAVTALGATVIGLLVLMRVSGLVNYADALADERHRSRFEALADHSHDAVVILDEHDAIAWASPAVHHVIGPHAQDVQGQPLHALLGSTTARDLAGSLDQLTAMAQGTTMDVHLTLEGSDGRDRHLEGVVTNLIDEPSVQGLVLVLRDVTDRVGMQQQLEVQAFTDPLTGLANRALFIDRVDHALTRTTAANGVGILFVDLDDFKEVNDSLGHGQGDELLVEVGRRIVDALHPSDTAARLGGDEFAVLLEDVDVETAEATAARVLELLALPVVVGDLPISVLASVGVAVTDPHTTSVADLMRNADLAMYEAKRAGKGQVRRFRRELHERELRQFTFRSELQAALERQQFQLVYQPIVAMDTEAIVGAEALLRWEHPDHGVVSPLDFIPVAESTRAIVPIGRWVLETACEQLARIDRPDRPLHMDVNVSAVQLTDPGFLTDVERILARTGVVPEHLVLELTESILVHDADRAREVLEGLRSLGVQLAIDDFGTGYSSLAYLQHFPIDIVKIDRSFVNQLGESGKGRSLARSIIAIAGSLGIDTIAEGIETPAQAADLTALDCDRGQGYHYSRPIPASDFEQLVERALLHEA